MDTSAVICVCSGICGCKCLWNQAVEKTVRLFGPFVSAQKKQIHRVTCSKWKIIQEQHFLVSSLIKFPLFPVAVHVCVFETWWIHTAIHPARQCFHYFTTSLIPSSWSFSVRMDGKHPVKLPHTFTSTQLIVTAHHTNAQREKEDEIKTANFGKEIRVRKKGRMEMAKEKREKKNTVIESNCVPGSFSGYIRMCSRVRGLATFHAAAENDILSADRQHSITYTQTKTFFQHVLLLSNWRDEEWALTVCSRKARHKLSFILV